jgi:hypothetical protein
MIERKPTPKRARGYSDINKLIFVLAGGHGLKYEMSIASYRDCVFGLMVYGFTPQDIARMIRKGIQESDLARLSLPDLIKEYILGPSPYVGNIKEYYEVFYPWARKYRRRNKKTGANVSDFCLERARRITQDGEI